MNKTALARHVAATELISKSAVRDGRGRRDPRARAVPVFLVEDNRLLRDGLAAMLGAQGLKVVARARGGAEALRQATRLRPQVVLLDAALGDRDSLRLVEAVRRVSPTTKVIVMDLLPAHEDVAAFVRAGVSGFITKDAGIAEFVATIRAVARGENVLPPRLVGTLFSHVAAQAATRGAPGRRAAVRMTVREREVATLIADGLPNGEIAARLGIAAHTVKSHLHNILEKLALHTRLEVAAFARSSRGPRTPKPRLR